jgi:hypothetical protein
MCKGRQGFQIKMACLVCNVALCNIVRRENKTCFELFREIEEMNNPCETNHSPARVKWAAHNQSQPPSRRRNILFVFYSSCFKSCSLTISSN